MVPTPVMSLRERGTETVKETSGRNLPVLSFEYTVFPASMNI